MGTTTPFQPSWNCEAILPIAANGAGLAVHGRAAWVGRIDGSLGDALARSRAVVASGMSRTRSVVSEIRTAIDAAMGSRGWHAAKARLRWGGLIVGVLVWAIVILAALSSTGSATESQLCLGQWVAL